MTKQITVGPVKIGGGAPVSIQSMLNTRTTDVEGSLAADPAARRRRVRDCTAWPCRDHGCSRGLSAKSAATSPLPLVADIHFDYRLAIARCRGRRAAKIRINPGNIGGRRSGQGRGGLLPGAPYSHPHRRQRRQSGKETSWRNTGTPRRRRWSKAHFPTSGCWKNSASMISACR